MTLWVTIKPDFLQNDLHKLMRLFLDLSCGKPQLYLCASFFLSKSKLEYALNGH